MYIFLKAQTKACLDVFILTFVSEMNGNSIHDIELIFVINMCESLASSPINQISWLKTDQPGFSGAIN